MKPAQAIAFALGLAAGAAATAVIIAMAAGDILGDLARRERAIDDASNTGAPDLVEAPDP